MSGLMITNLIVGGLMVLTYFRVEDGGLKGAILLILGFWFLAQILPSGCFGNPPIFQ